MYFLAFPAESSYQGTHSDGISSTIFQLKNQSLEKWLILRLRQGISEMSLRYFVVPENEEQKHPTVMKTEGLRSQQRALNDQSLH